MKKIRNLILVFLFLFPISHAFASITFVHKVSVAKNDSTSIDDSGNHIAGIHFNDNGTKMFISYRQDFDDAFPHVSQYSLSEPYNISTRTYDGDAERCNLTVVSQRVTDLAFSHDGYKMFVSVGVNDDGADDDAVYGYELTSPYDISTCSYSNNKTTDLDGKLNGPNFIISLTSITLPLVCMSANKFLSIDVAGSLSCRYETFAKTIRISLDLLKATFINLEP